MPKKSEPKIEVVGNFYVIDGKKYVRMTRAMKTIPNFWLEQWVARVGVEKAKEYADETARLGDMIHLVTELYDLKKRDELRILVGDNEWLAPYLLGWMKYRDAYIDKIIWVERIVWSEKLKLAGRIDRLVLFKRDTIPSILDIKSTETLHDGIGVQVCGYREMAEEMIVREKMDRGLIPQRTVVAHLPGPRYDKDGIERVIFDKVKVKEYQPEKYYDRMVECVNDFWYLSE